MQFRCEADKLIESLQIATRALPSRTPNQVLEGILIQTDMNDVILTCSDERMTIVTRFQAEVSQPGRGVVPGKLFTEVVRRLSEGEIDVNMNDRFVFRIQGSGSRTNISGYDADLYPRLQAVTGTEVVALPQDTLKDMIQKTEFAIAAEDMREVLTGGYLEIENGDITMVGLDGFRLALKRSAYGSAETKFRAIIPGRAVSDIGKLLSDEPDRFAELRLNGGKLYLKLDSTEIYVTLIEGEYVRYRSILPTSFATRVTVAVEPLRKGIDRAALIAREGNNNLLILKIREGSMAIESHSQIGDVFEELQVMQEGPDLNIAFNVKYLIDVMRYIDAGEIEINLNNAISPCIITPVDDKQYVHLVLPVRTGLTN